MSTYDYTEGTQAQSAKLMSYASAHNCHVVKRKFDVATVIAWNTTLAANAEIGSGDIFKVIPVPDDTWVIMAGMKVITAFGACTDVDIGTNGGDEFYDGGDPNGATAGAHIRLIPDQDYGTATGKTFGYLYTTADTIDFKFNAAETTGTALLYAIMFDVADDVGTD